MTRPPADPHRRFDDWLLSGARGEPARDLALHASLCAVCRARISAIDLLTAVDPGQAPMPPALVGVAGRPVTALRRAGRIVGAFAAVTVVAALIGVAGWRMIDLQRLTERADANAGETPGQGVLGGTGESSQPPSPEGSAAAPSPSQPGATIGPTQTTAASAQPASQPVQPAATARPATPRPSTPRPSVSSSPSTSASPSASATPTSTESSTPTPSSSATPTPSETATPTPTETPTPEPTPTPTPSP